MCMKILELETINFSNLYIFIVLRQIVQIHVTFLIYLLNVRTLRNSAVLLNSLLLIHVSEI